MISDQEKRNAWLSFAAAALMISDPDEDVENVVDDAAIIADDMLEKFLDTFESPMRAEREERPKRGRGKRR